MLRMIGCIEPTAATVLVDEFVPLRIQWAPGLSPSTQYWRRGKDPLQLIELGLDPRTQTLRSLAMPLAGGPGAVRVDLAAANKPSSTFSVEKGFPVFELSGWPPSGRRDEWLSFGVKVDSESTLITFDANLPVRYALESEAVQFYFSANAELAALRVTLAPGQVTQLVKALSF